LITHGLKLSRTGGVLYSLVDEYWCPTSEWRIWEYLGKSATVIRRVEEAEINQYDSMLIKLDEDAKKAQQIWPLI